jgi:hypothetical protein
MMMMMYAPYRSLYTPHDASDISWCIVHLHDIPHLDLSFKYIAVMRSINARLTSSTSTSTFKLKPKSVSLPSSKSSSITAWSHHQWHTSEVANIMNAYAIARVKPPQMMYDITYDLITHHSSMMMQLPSSVIYLARYATF